MRAAGNTGARDQREQQFVVANHAGEHAAQLPGQATVPPQPHAVDRRQATRLARGIQRVLVQQYLHLVEQHAPRATVRTLRQVLVQILAQRLLGRGEIRQLHIGRQAQLPVVRRRDTQLQAGLGERRLQHLRESLRLVHLQ